MARVAELRDTLFVGDRRGDALYRRIFVVSAIVTTLMPPRAGVNARFVDLGGWREEAEHSLEYRIGVRTRSCFIART